jgi:pilus assembly protein CpaC
VLDQQPTSRLRAYPNRYLTRFGSGLALAALLGPLVAAAQEEKGAPVPIPPPALPNGVEGRVIPPPVPVAIPPSQDGSTTKVPSVPAPRVIQLSPSETLAPIKPVVQPTIPTVIQVDPAQPPPGTPPGGARVINLVRDTTGLVPNKPPGPPIPRPVEDVAQGVKELIADVKEPEAEINVPIGQTKLIETKRLLTRVAIANTATADVEVLSDQPNSRLLNLYGRSFGTTNLTLWDTEDKPVSFLVRVTLDTRDLEARIKQAYPGAVVHIRQIGSQVILEGQVADNKSVGDILQLVQTELRYSGGLRAAGGGGGTGGGTMGGAAGGGAAGGGGGGAGGGGGGGNMPMAGGGGGGMGGGMGGGGAVGGLVIINRIHVPGPRQVLLRVKIAELNRDAIRELGVSWFRSKDNSLIGSTIGGIAGITGTANSTLSSGAVNGVLKPITSTVGATGSATNAAAQLFGIFDAFSLFLDALKSNQMAKLLAEPNLMTLDGQPAQFIAGGQFPFPAPQSSSFPGGTGVVTIQLKPFGTILTFLPQILPNDVIRLDVEPIFSALNFGQGTTVNGGRVPAIDMRSARTVVELREGQTLAIAGLLQQTTNGTTVRVPILGDLPVVGTLFSSNKIETVETELIVLVTPELVAPMELQEVPESPGDRVIQPNDFEFYFLGRIEGKSGKDFRATVRELDPLNVMKHFQSENQWVIGPHGHAD